MSLLNYLFGVRLSLRKFFYDWYVPRRLPGARPNTLRLYEVLFRHLDKFLGREPLVSDLTEETVARFLRAMADGRAPRTVNKCRDQLLALARFACAKGLLREVPDCMALPEPKRLPDYWEVGELGSLLSAAGSVRGEICGLPAVYWWRSLFLLLFDTGLRISAMMHLPQRCVDLDGRWILATAETQKQFADQRLRFSEQTRTTLLRIWLPTRELLFPWPFDVGTLYNRLSGILRAAGLPCDRRCKFQKLRRTNANLGRKHGGALGFDPCAQLGHSSDAVTREFYLSPESSVQAADVLPRPTF